VSTNLVSGIATLAVATGTPLPAGNAAQASISVVVTDAGGTAYPAVVLTGAEQPTAWAYGATYAAGAATAVATALDVNGATIGTPASYPFTVTGSGEATTYTAPAGFSFAASAPTPLAKSISGVPRK
jgi:hypothetical protein